MKKPARAKKPAAAKKPAKPFKAVPVAVQIRRHHAAVAAARKSAAQPASVKRARHIAAVKAVKTRAANAAKARGWSPDEDVAMCSARAVAEVLRLCSGLVLTDGDVLWLHDAACGDPDEGAVILDVLRTAGLAWQSVELTPEPAVELLGSGQRPAPLILGLDLGVATHAVTVAPDGTWWSWGEPYTAADFPGAVVEEAWVVTW